MKKGLFLPLRGFLLAGLVILFSALTSVVSAQPFTQTSTIFSATKVENRFPVAITFRTHVESKQRIEKAQFFFRVRNNSSTTRVDLLFHPATELDLDHTWNTAKQTIPPSTPIFYYWQVTLANGEVVKTDEALVYYDDTRFDWQVREQDDLSVWWHDRPTVFGTKSFELALAAFNQQKTLFQTKVDYPIRIIIYNNKEEFAVWNEGNVDFIGGQAFPALGITTQIVNDDEVQDYWLNEVIPHEISHLYFYQSTYHAISRPPSWLDEGVAQYNEFGNQSWAQKNAQDAILTGNYIPLKSLAYGFGHDEEKFRLAYDESISAVSFMVDQYGREGLMNLMAAYKNGRPTEEAFPSALGVTLEEFEIDWLTSLGVTDGMYPGFPEHTFPTFAPTSGYDFYLSLLWAGGILVGISIYCVGVPLIIVALVFALRKKNQEN